MHIFHCVRKRDYDPNTEFYGHRSIQKCGFIHCSDLDTYYLVAPNFAADPEERILLLINTDKVTAPIRWEDGGANTDFPHIYGLLNTDAVETVLPHLWSEDRVWIPNKELAQYGFDVYQPDISNL